MCYGSQAEPHELAAGILKLLLPRILLSEHTTELFIKITHEEYYRRFGEHFGKTILGFFVDEPGFYNNFWGRNVESLPWTSDFASQFAQRRGYDLLPWIPALWENSGDKAKQVRFDYWLTVSELFKDRFFSKLADWCEDHGVWLTDMLRLKSLCRF